MYRALGVPEVLLDEHKPKSSAAKLLKRALGSPPMIDWDLATAEALRLQIDVSRIVKTAMVMLRAGELDPLLGEYGIEDEAAMGVMLCNRANEDEALAAPLETQIKLAESMVNAIVTCGCRELVRVR